MIIKSNSVALKRRHHHLAWQVSCCWPLGDTWRVFPLCTHRATSLILPGDLFHAATSPTLPGDLFHALTPSLLQIVAKKYRNYDFPAEMTGLWRYLKNAYARDEFTNTCAADSEIELAYADVAKRLSRSWTWPSRPIAAAEGLHRLPKDSGFTHFSSTPPLETSVSIRPHLSGILGTPPPAGFDQSQRHLPLVRQESRKQKREKRSSCQPFGPGLGSVCLGVGAGGNPVCGIVTGPFCQYWNISWDALETYNMLSLSTPPLCQ